MTDRLGHARLQGHNDDGYKYALIQHQITHKKHTWYKREASAHNGNSSLTATANKVLATPTHDHKPGAPFTQAIKSVQPETAGNMRLRTLNRRGLSRITTSAMKAWSFPSNQGIWSMVFRCTNVTTSALRSTGISLTISCSLKEIQLSFRDSANLVNIARTISFRNLFRALQVHLSPDARCDPRVRLDGHSYHPIHCFSPTFTGVAWI